MKRLNGAIIGAIILTVIVLLCVGCSFPVIRTYPEPQLAETEASFVWEKAEVPKEVLVRR